MIQPKFTVLAMIAVAYMFSMSLLVAQSPLVLNDRIAAASDRITRAETRLEEVQRQVISLAQNQRDMIEKIDSLRWTIQSSNWIGIALVTVITAVFGGDKVKAALRKRAGV